MNKSLALRLTILAGIFFTSSLLLLVSDNFSKNAILNVLGTFAAIIAFAIFVGRFILRR